MMCVGLPLEAQKPQEVAVQRNSGEAHTSPRKPVLLLDKATDRPVPRVHKPGKRTRQRRQRLPHISDHRTSSACLIFFFPLSMTIHINAGGSKVGRGIATRTTAIWRDVSRIKRHKAPASDDAGRRVSLSFALEVIL